jgi:hypothetical protein
MRVRIRLASLRRLLIGSLTALVFFGFWAEVWDDLIRLEDPWDLIEFFGLSYEENLPTWFVSVLLSGCATALALIALATRQAGGRYVAHWWGLAVAFFYISLDEVVQIHEEMSDWFDYGGVLYFSWVIPAGIAVAILGLIYLRFLGHLPGHFRNRFVLAGGLYVGGALGTELALGYWTDMAGRSNFTYAMIDLVQESLELAGVALFFYSLVEYLCQPAGGLGIELAPPKASEREGGA